MTIHFISLGCDKNLVDSEVMLGIIREEGHSIVLNPEEAEIIIVNTCGFIMDATDEGIQTILQMAEYKTVGKCRALIVTGCMVQRYQTEIFKELPEVDAVVGVGDIGMIGKVVNEVSAGQKNIAVVNGLDKAVHETVYMNRVLSSPGHFAYLKIAEGCDNCCAYCTIPTIRGGYRSRNKENIINEVTTLARQGVKEIILVAQDTSLYGTDIYGKAVLPELLNDISTIDGICWIRLLYCYPEHITDELIEQMANNPKICHYIDMPVQHGSDEVLKRMGRQSDVEGILKTISKLRYKIPDISIRTTVMTGFPGETQEDFDILVQFLKDAAFDKLGVFAYSREEGTAAYDMPDQIDESIKAERKDILMETQQKISAKVHKHLVGKTFSAIVDGFHSEQQMYCARSHRDCYEIDGLIFFESETEIMTGEFVNLRITDSSDYDLLGELVVEA